MTFAFHKNKDQVVRNIANLRTFEHSGIAGRQGPCTRLNRLPREYRRGLDNAVYVVYCYDTPIAWVTMADDATEEGRVNFMPDWQYSATTTYYQKLVWQAWGDKVADPNPRYSKAENRGTERGRSSDVRYNRGNARAQEQARFRTNHRGVRYDSLVERDTSYEHDMAEARSRAERDREERPVSLRTALAGTGARMNFREQDDLMDEVSGYRHPSHP